MVELSVSLRRRGMTPLRIVGTQGYVPGEVGSDGGGVSNFTRAESRYQFLIGNVAAHDLQIAYANYWSNGASGEAVDNGITIEACLERISPSYYNRLYFDGAVSRAVGTGASFVLTDPSGFDGAANEKIGIRTGLVVTAGDLWRPTNNARYTGDGFVRSSSVSSQIAATGVLTTPGGGEVATYGYGPIAILGKPVSAQNCVAVVGDSIARGYQDTGESATGALGFVTRGLVSGGIPWANLSKGGNTYNAERLQYGPRKKSICSFASDAIVSLGTNDIAGLTTIGNLQTYALEVWQALKNRGCRVHVCTLFPRTTSSDNWATAANQTPVSGFGVGQTRDLFNAWVLTQVGVTIDSVIDVNAALEDPANPGKWITNGVAFYVTPDGVHMNAVGSALAAPLVAADMATFPAL